MVESGPSAGAESAPEPALDPGAMIAALRRRGADQVDPVRFRFIVALAGRAQACRGDARRIIDGKLADALSEYRERFEQAHAAAGETLTRAAETFPAAGDALRRLFDAGNFGGLRRSLARLHGNSEPTPLGDLCRHLAQQTPAGLDDDPARIGRPLADLKSLRYFGNTWSQLSVDRQVSDAIAQGPKNAGPLNSHQLVLQALASMRELSPDYLRRFMSYADALLWLDQAHGRGTPTDRNVGRGESERKRRRSR